MQHLYKVIVTNKIIDNSTTNYTSRLEKEDKHYAV